MTNRATPDAPLSHANEAAHRRLIAQRANAIGYEAGEFTPEFTFATEGDLSVSYASQVGEYWRIGALVFIDVNVDCTPTFSTASGDASISGLPFAVDSSGQTQYFIVRLGGSGVTYPASTTGVLGFANAGSESISIVAQGSGSSGTTLQASDFSSGSLISPLRVQGFYPI